MKNKKVNIYILFAIVFLQGFVFYGPVATLYRQARGLSMYDIFLIESISWILMIVFEVPWGWFADRFGYKKTLIIANFVFFISKFVFFAADTFWLFLLERILIALAIAGITGCDIALMYCSIEEDKATRIFGRYDAFAHAGFLFAALMSSAIVAQSLDSTAYYTIFPYGLAAILALFLNDKDVQVKEKPQLRRSIKAALSNKQILVLIISVALMREVVQAVSVFLNQPQYLRSGIDVKYFGLLVALMQVVRLISARADSFSNRFGQTRTLGGMYTLIALSCLILIYTTNPFLSVLSVLMMCGGAALIGPIAMEVQNKAITVADRATILSLYAMTGDIVSAAINPVIGKSADISIVNAMVTCLLISLFALGLFLVYRKKSLKSIVQICRSY